MVLPKVDPSAHAKLIEDRLSFIATAEAEYGNLTAALQKAAAMLQTQATNTDLPDGLKQH